MQISVQAGALLRESADLAVLALFEGEALPDAVAALIEADDFRAQLRQTALLYPRGAIAPRRLLLLGLGPKSGLSAEAIRQVAALAVQQAGKLGVTRFTMGLNGAAPLPPVLAGQAFAEGLELGQYRFLTYKSNLSKEQTHSVAQVQLLIDAGDPAPIAEGIAVGQALAHGAAFARDLANTPGNDLTPAHLADAAATMGAELGQQVTIFDKARLDAEGFKGILAVGQGSVNEPRFVIIEHGAAEDGKPTICLVGKGITFDTGGISIKPADKMDDMKMDMGGAAAVLGAMRTIGELQLPLHVVGLICAAENMPSGAAYKPGDIVGTLSGKTIEVLNTDAEGRIVLADGLFYAQRYKPAAIVDLATLTGAIMVALGPHATGLMSNNQDLADRIVRAGESSGERAWQMPVWEEYRDTMKSEIADLKNTGGRFGGALTAAGFLAAFVGDYPWAHLDIAGTAWVERPAKAYHSRGATGVGARLLVELLKSYIQ